MVALLVKLDLDDPQLFVVFPDIGERGVVVLLTELLQSLVVGEGRVENEQV